MTIGRPCGQKEDLSNRVRQILRSYDTEAHIFTEMIQNADDAGSTEIRFIIDYRQLSHENVFEHKGYHLLLGPALCVWNDSIFTEEDHKGINSLGKGSKENSLFKTGRFGVGINSMYHITDAIQFISNGDTYTILDPLCKHFPDIDSANPGRQIDIRNEMKGDEYSGVIKGFNFMQLENATMFRFALRSEIVENETQWLSKKTYSSDDIKKIILDFAANASELLLFLKNIRKIAFYELDENNNLKELKSYQMKFENVSDKRRLDQFWSDFKDEIRQGRGIEFGKINCRKLQLIIRVESTNPNETKRFCVSQQFGFEKKLNKIYWDKINNLEINRSKIEGKFFPLAGIAFNLNLEDSSEYRMYNFLPLHQLSPIECHVNGYFALHQDNRTQIFQHKNIAIINKINTDEAEWCTEWNSTLITYIVQYLYLESMIDRARFGFEAVVSIEDHHKLIDKFLNVFQSFPSKGKQVKSCELSEYFDSMKMDFFKNVAEIDCIPIYSLTKKRVELYKPNALIFSTKLEKFFDKKKEKNDTRKVIHQFVSTIIEKYCNYHLLPDLFLLNSDKSIKLQILDSNTLLKRLIDFGHNIIGVHVENSIFKCVENVAKILNFCIEDQINKSLHFLEKAPLMVTSDCRIKEFLQSNKIFCLKASHIDFFKQFCESEFLHPNLLNITQLSNDELFFKEFDIKNLDQVFLKAFGEQMKLADGDPYPKLVPIIGNSLKLIWEFLIEYIRKQKLSRKNEIELLSVIKDWPLIPVITLRNIDEVKLAPVRDLQKILSSCYREKMQQFLATHFYLSTSLDILNKISIVDRRLLDLEVSYLIKDKKILTEFIDHLTLDPILRPPDYVILLPQMTRTFLTVIDSKLILKNLNNFLKKHYYPYNPFCNNYYITMMFRETEDLKSDDELRKIIMSLTIFESFISNKLVSLENHIKTVAIQDDNQNEYTKAHFEIYCKTRSIVLIKSMEYPYLKEYLKIESKNSFEFYKEILKSDSIEKSPRVMEEHMTFLKNVFKRKGDEGWNQQFKQFLQNIVFIELDEEFFRPSQLCDPVNSLFVAGFSKSLLPEKYNNPEWLEFLKYLNLRVETTSEDVLTLAGFFEKKFQTGRMSVKELERLCQLLLKEMPKLNCLEIEKIKKIEFIPSYFAGLNLLSIHQMIFDPVASQDNVCLEDSYFKEDLDFVWTTNSIIPDYCRTTVVQSLAKSTPSLKKIVDNFVNIVQRCSNDKFVNDLSGEHKSQLNTLFLKYYDKFQEVISDESIKFEVRRLENLNCVWNERNGQIYLDKANYFYTKLSQEEAIPPYILSLPNCYKKYSELMILLGCNQTKVSLEACIKAMNDFKSFEGDQLPLQCYDSVLKLYKTLIFDDVLSNNYQEKYQFYAPSSDGIMLKLNDLYYDADDKEVYAHLRKIKLPELNFIFDSDELKSKYLKTSGESIKNNDVIMKARMMNSWDQIFQRSPYFINNPELSAKPITNFIERRLINDILDFEKHTKLSSIIKSSLFCYLVDKEVMSECRLEESVLNPGLKEIVSSLKVVLKDVVKSSYFYCKDGKQMEIDEQTHDFIETENANEKMNERKIVFSTTISEKKHLFYLSEILMEKIIEKMNLSSLKQSKLIQWKLKYKIIEYLESIGKLKSFK